MRIAIAGKGGTGKTTIAGTLARLLARSGRQVLAVDADTNPNLSVTLGIPAASARQIVSLPLDLLERRTDPDGATRSVFAADAEAVVRDYAMSGPDGVQLLMMGKVNHSGAG